MNLTLFDLDHTLLAGDSDYLWGRFLVDEGVVDGETYARENERFHAQYQAGNLDIHAYQRFVLAPLREQPLPRMHDLRARYVRTRIAPIVARHARALIAHHRDRGDALAIITATNRFITEPIADLLDIDTLIATEPEVVDGLYSGEIAGTPSFQDGKIVRAQAWTAAQPQPFEHVTFYSDSHNDLPLLRWADTAIAVDPDERLAEAARAADWAIISLRGETRPF
ncbi:phosphoserine phosphatase [Salinisphaera orenii MK-B5]|uniref:Phosphoserine phosphatase n=1 Tax=Salinisphaera orenii MK-B5 TaxID=856730 RepID=A0A423PF95_9GAMM|nr:HAD family hydrolase [Salinisphaera orenii]ROO24254.1 phosphoserine phosphatase [Salinisphaera orenii MK-B5]